MSDEQGWEARMSARAKARVTPEPDALSTAHSGHTTHVCFPNVRCSCGEVVSVVCFVITGNEVYGPCPECGHDRMLSQ